MAWAIPLSFLHPLTIRHSVLFVSFCGSSYQFVGLFNTYLTLDYFHLWGRKEAPGLCPQAGYVNEDSYVY